MSIVNHLQGLVHNPYGLEHPYEQEPTERFPRDPVTGEPTSLGVATWPAGAAEAVWATWRREGATEDHLAEGHWEQDTGGRSYWRVELPPFGYRDRVTYRLHARQDRRQLSTEDFSFVASGWSPVETENRHRIGRRDLVLECRTGDLSLRTRARISFPRPQFLHVRLAALDSSLPEDSDGCVHFRVVEETEERIVLTTKRLECRIYLHPFRLEVCKIDGTPLLLEAEAMAWLMGEPDCPLRVRQTFASPPDEGFYGFGGRYNTLNQRGNCLDLRVFSLISTRTRANEPTFRCPFSFHLGAMASTWPQIGT